MGVTERVIRAAPRMISLCDSLNFFMGKFSMNPIDELPEFSSIDKEDLSAPIAEFLVMLVAREEPKAHGNLRRIKQLAWQSDHAINQVGFEDVFPNLTFTGLVRRHATVR